MKIKNIAAICKKNKYAVIYERYGESGGVIQYVGDGAAAKADKPFTVVRVYGRY